MKIHPIAPALWKAAMLNLVGSIILHTFNIVEVDIVLSLLFYLFFTEMSKFVAEMTMEPDNSDEE